MQSDFGHYVESLRILDERIIQGKDANKLREEMDSLWESMDSRERDIAQSISFKLPKSSYEDIPLENIVLSCISTGSKPASCVREFICTRTHYRDSEVTTAIVSLEAQRKIKFVSDFRIEKT